MVGERRNGNLLVQLGPRQQAYPEELIRQRRTHDGQTEYLIRWTLLAVEDGTGTGSTEAAGSGSSGSGAGGSGGSTSGESKTENILMWMSTEDVYANCPTLLGKRKAPAMEEEERPSSSGGGGGSFRPPDVTFDEVELSDMKDDVVNLVRRARKQMAKTSEFAISLTHTIHVLSAYASIGSLVGVFKETGALDLLMELLCNKERQTRRSAGKMLRALASHDAGTLRRHNQTCADTCTPYILPVATQHSWPSSLGLASSSLSIKSSVVLVVTPLHGLSACWHVSH